MISVKPGKKREGQDGEIDHGESGGGNTIVRMDLSIKMYTYFVVRGKTFCAVSS